MKRRQRKPVLDFNGESESSRRRWPNERHIQNGSPSNPLANLLGQYNSDSEVEDDSKPRSHILNDQVNDFLKEIQSIAPEDSNKSNVNSAVNQPTSYWQECYDEQTGFPYYWHTETNQVTWEMPSELKILLENNQREKTNSQNSNIPQWSNIPPNKYSQSQSNIPEGMIPKEVVVRNRNRQAGILNSPAKPPIKTNNNKSPSTKSNDNFDEGKIEMITSFGNDESESDESEKEESQKKSTLTSCLKKPLLKTSHQMKLPALQKSPTVNKISEPSDPKIQGPTPPPLLYGPQNREKLTQQISQNLQSSKTVSNSEEDILQRLKNQAKLLQFLGSNTATKEQELDSNVVGEGETSKMSTKDLKLSLVPGYEDDSEGEEESNSFRRSGAKALFPIPDSSVNNDSNSNEKLAKKIETGSSNIRIYEYRNIEMPINEHKLEEETNDDAVIEDKQEECKAEHEAKANKFLESMSIDAPNKNFQRKKRIAFDVAPTKGKSQESGTEKDEIPTNVTSSTTETLENRGLPFSKEEASGSIDSNKPNMETISENKKVPPIVFVKATKDEEEDKTKEIDETIKVELRLLTEPIMEKLKFLSEGSPAASAVQVMAIQIQTLLCAWESGDLQETYLRNWLHGTGCELTRLEQTAAPPGWECQWDRSHKRYYYRNTVTNEAQWTYPEADIVGGTEEMELCTTPPPPEHEETPIIEMTNKSVLTAKESEQLNEQPPPPPTISSPSPPPPPRIFAEDLKRNRKRKNSSEAESSETKADEEVEKPTEPLPPGVDPPEIAYSLSASALEAGVLYGAQQTNPIYAATLAGAGIPLISHHHTAIMQGQLMHYNSAYHQHLHNQALVAARLSGQEAVQLMVAAEYARVYENNQVIAKPPMKMPHETSLGSAINSFYSDIASIEKSSADLEKEKAELLLAETASLPVSQVPQVEIDPTSDATKERKKKKLKTGIGKKQKEMCSMVAKWQRAQKNFKEGH